MRKRVALVVRLFREAGKAVHSMPLLHIQPFWVLDVYVIPDFHLTYNAISYNMTADVDRHLRFVCWMGLGCAVDRVIRKS